MKGTLDIASFIRLLDVVIPEGPFKAKEVHKVVCTSFDRPTSYAMDAFATGMLSPARDLILSQMKICMDSNVG